MHGPHQAQDQRRTAGVVLVPAQHPPNWTAALYLRGRPLEQVAVER